MLDHPIYDGRDAELSHSASIWFGDFLAPHRAWFVFPFPDALQQFISVFPQPRKRRLYGHPIDPGRSVITFDLFVRPVQIISVQDAFHQIVCTVSFFTFPSSGTPHSRILFVFHTIPLRAALSVFCFHRTGSPSSLYSRLTIVQPFRLPLTQQAYYGVC
ncbi:hypothetical protein D3C75_770360 [compost metagenome]